jgi:UDP-2,3-diacylglucosamine hydrolase
MRPTYIASDIHLGAVSRETELAFEDFVEHLGAAASGLILAGDLFDFWFEYGEVVPGRHFRILAALARLVEAGVAVTMVGGNHDYWGGRFLEEEVGIKFSPRGTRLGLAGRPALVVHGDGVGRGDLRYRALKALLRSRIAISGFRALHPSIGMRIARAVSSTDRKTGPDPHSAGRAAYIQEWALGQLAADPGLGWVICGHAHLPAIVAAGPGQHYLNAGDWLQHRSYIAVTPEGTARLGYWRDQAARSAPSTSTSSTPPSAAPRSL